ncbi:MAG: tRNA (guanosine(37)-N1)-methyltransferase TrmD [Clostridiales bacterium]|nr:tRNA (guanosine(37)-N1)-methyltransferase TrmD [Clostridiales bacterium]
MRIDILTLFPEMFGSLKESIIKRATDKNLVEINIIQIRDFSLDPHKKTDDIPYGGGAGMVMTPQPLYDAINSVKTDKSHVVYLSPRGRVFKQGIAKEFCSHEHLILICGHYEGIDQRIIDLCVNEELSIGDYVLTGGEIPAMVVVDSVVRLLDGVITSESLSEESFSSNLLEYPQYTRPQTFMGLDVPEVLLSGHHANIEKWRKEKSLEITQKNRPDLL